MVYPLDLVNLTALMDLTEGSSDIRIGLIDGPIYNKHPDLSENIYEIFDTSGACTMADSVSCKHGTFVAGVLMAVRGSAAPSICPGCTSIARPIFSETREKGVVPRATLEDLSMALIECADAGAKVINLSVSVETNSLESPRQMEDVINYLVKKGIIIVISSGNQGFIGGSLVANNSGVIPVVACDSQGRPIRLSNLGHSIGIRGLLAPGCDISSLGVDGVPVIHSGASIAAPFVTGAIALLWSIFPMASLKDIVFSLTQEGVVRRKTIVPPLLDSWKAYRALKRIYY